MPLTSTSFADGQAIPGEFAFCIPDTTNHLCMGKNLNPQLTKNDIPSVTKPFALICHSPDVPSNGDDVNREGGTVPAYLPRVDFFHWALIDRPAAVHCLNSGKFSQQARPRRKPGSQTRHGAIQRINNYTEWFAGDKNMRGGYYGYDGPCPPWNDEIVHRYVFTLYPLKIAHVPPEAPFGGREIRDAIKGRDLPEAALTGSQTLNSQLDYI